MKSSWDTLCETEDKQPLDRDPDRTGVTVTLVYSFLDRSQEVCIAICEVLKDFLKVRSKTIYVLFSNMQLS